MKKVCLYITFFIVFANNTSLYQLFKLPVLVEHLQEHRQWEGQISLWEFLCRHYSGGEPMDSDAERDRQLPFKSFDTSIVQTLFVSITPTTSIESVLHFFKTVFNVTGNHLFPDPGLSSLFRPPRF